VRTTTLGAPRPVPGRLLPIAAGAGVIVLALPIFLVADWPFAGWVIAAVVWVGVQGLGVVLSRVRPSTDNLAASSVLAFGMMGRLLAVLVVLVAVAASNRTVGLAAALLYGLAYTAELAVSIASYYAQEPKR
jgi:hypothetical protein